MMEDFLKVNQVDAKLVSFNKPVNSAKEIAQRLGVPLHHVLKTTVYLSQERIDEIPETVLVVSLADQSLSEQKIYSTFPKQSIRLASMEEALEATGYPKEFVPPISVYGAQTLLDERVLKQPKVAASAKSQPPKDRVPDANAKSQKVRLTANETTCGEAGHHCARNEPAAKKMTTKLEAK